MSEIGPVDYLIVSFPGNEFKGEILPAIGELVDNGTVRIIDLAFVAKDADGNVLALELSDLAPDMQDAFGRLGVEIEGLFNDEDLVSAGEVLEPNSSAALLVWENVWARRTAQAIRNAGGVVLDFERVPHSVVESVRAAVLEAAAESELEA